MSEQSAEDLQESTTVEPDDTGAEPEAVATSDGHAEAVAESAEAGPKHDPDDKAGEQAAEADDRPPQQRLTPGAVLDHGRYRLLAHVGTDSRCDAQMWRARDGVLGRDVALTVLVGDRSDAQAAANARRTLERAMHTSTFNHIGVARVLDVVNYSPGDPENVLGVVIAEWTQGTDLLSLVADGPVPPGTAARLLEPLAAAVEAAHHGGLVLGNDHPQRIRITADGQARMAFPGPLPNSNSSDDVRGLGAVLYLLLTGRWALHGGPDAVAEAPMGADGRMVAPRALRPTVPLELSTVAVRALGSTEPQGITGGVRTGAAVLRVLEQYATVAAADTVMQAAPAGSGTRADTVWHHEEPQPDLRKRKKLAVSIAVLSAASLLIVGWITAMLIGAFTGGGASGPSVILRPNQREQPSEQQQPPETRPSQGDTGQPRPAPPQTVSIVDSDVFVTEQGRDNRDEVGKVHDGDPSTHWATDSYLDQFGTGFKNGIGVLLTLQQPVSVTEVVIDSPSDGAKVQIRAASDTSPTLSGAKILTTETLSEGTTSIPVSASKPSKYILVWITELSGDGRYQAQINEITIKGTPEQR